MAMNTEGGHVVDYLSRPTVVACLYSWHLTGMDGEQLLLTPRFTHVVIKTFNFVFVLNVLPFQVDNFLFIFAQKCLIARAHLRKVVNKKSAAIS